MNEKNFIQKFDEDIENSFIYHVPKEGQPEKYKEIRAKAKEFAYLIKELTPMTHEQEIALQKLDEVVFWANATIARNE